MAKVTRELIAQGDRHVIECAIRSDGVTSPVADFLDELSNGEWAPGPEEPLLQDEQIQIYEQFLAEMELLSDEGQLSHPKVWNQLMDGIWEFKRREVRVTFYDTDGFGYFEPKYAERNPITHSCPLPAFDPFIRLGTAYQKYSQRAPQQELDLAKTVRREDVAHDREP